MVMSDVEEAVVQGGHNFVRVSLKDREREQPKTDEGRRAWPKLTKSRIIIRRRALQNAVAGSEDEGAP